MNAKAAEGIWLVVKAAENGPQTRVWVLLNDLPEFLAKQPALETGTAPTSGTAK